MVWIIRDHFWLHPSATWCSTLLNSFQQIFVSQVTTKYVRSATCFVIRCHLQTSNFQLPKFFVPSFCLQILKIHSKQIAVRNSNYIVVQSQLEFSQNKFEENSPTCKLVPVGEFSNPIFQGNSSAFPNMIFQGEILQLSSCWLSPTWRHRSGAACAARPFWAHAFDVSIAPTTAFAAGRSAGCFAPGAWNGETCHEDW